MIDIHSHILPGLDDGAKSIEETLEMVSQLQQSGFKTLIATPHVLEDNFLSPADILAYTEQVGKRVAEAGIQIEILPGSENYIFPEMGKWAREGKLMTLGNTGKYILVELPMLEIPQYTDQVFFELQVNGLTPVLAHPERNRGLVEAPERLLEWAGKGVFFQLNLRSLDGRYGPQSKGLAEILLHSNLIHFIGSDAHRVSRRESTYPETLRSVRERVGESRFQELTVINPRNILRGQGMQCRGEYVLIEPVKKRKQRFWNCLKAAFSKGRC
ncbi:tyrosine-protein phosphatase [Desulfosporosinus shakirovi]|uniref:tyrosine-protein phosphatase n=1 Tax=Desulfosporosinus shakirovi TaxID=2885154 RepID=UPI001E62CE56|nr:CpsB/CapC family capsule biosynthesis tyrosine phosphatase [Desulfosporosinus sp. SRJS8]MCB8818383.1 histidinol-phosphatase [Desulfosporosinus sp. SRJS8]